MSSDPTSLAALRDQMAQLDALHAQGVLGDAPHQEARAALERRIVDAVLGGATEAAAAPAAAHSPAASARPSATLIGGLVLAVVAVAGVGYALMGQPRAVNSAAPTVGAAAPAAAASGGGHPITSAQIESMIEKLVARLKEKPDDVDGWAMLGRSYAMLGKHDLALPALKRAAEGRPDNAGLIADYADAMAVVGGGNLAGEPAKLIERALKIDPDNLKALSLAGTIAFNKKDYAGALRHWERLAQLAPTSDYLKQIQGGIDEARQNLPGGAAASGAAASAKPAGAAAATATAAGAAAISGTVTLAKSLAGKANPDDTLFVFARAAEGPRMPLAILRKQVKDLPLTFTLDDSLAMTPAMKLSSATRVVVGARISKRGEATVLPGDLQGLSPPMAPSASGLKLEITEVVGP